jgi:prolyl 4-hydroxylase
MHAETRCPIDPAAPWALYPGDISRMYERILADPAFAKYEPKVLSRPDYAPNDGPETADYQLGMWMVVLENICTETEAQRMIELASARGFERSADVGEELEDGSYGDDINEGRTSENAWCEEGCEKDTVAKDIMERIEHITSIPKENQESLQQLRYQVGQFYQTHNDFIEYQVRRPVGPRILTFFM